jgi:hypothetical protein
MRLLFAGVCLVSSFLGLSVPAAANDSCLKLLGDLRDHLFRGSVRIHHSTNYFANTNAFNGWVYGCWLDRAPNQGFKGSGLACIRQILREGQKPAEESMGYEITADAKLTFVVPGSNTRYGPYEMTCMSDKFAIVNTFDSIETFVFIKQ